MLHHTRMARLLFLSALALCLGACTLEKPPAVEAAEATLPDKVDFNLHIKPILSDRCFTCHGPDGQARKAGLRLDDPELARTALESGSGYALVSGSLRKSRVYHRIISTDPEVQMPPPESNLRLSAEEIALLARWIEQGAEYQPHWSLIPPKEPSVPEIDGATHPIDAFVQQRLSTTALSPNPIADKETLIRRASFDLTGLPPTLEEIDAFLADEAPDAFDKVLDRLLAASAYGERLATEWLDVARYADSHGYQDDGFRTSWPWRDWVVRAFNKNLPFDQFLTWQLAGDLLPNPSHEQILSTSFNRNHMQSQEGGIVLEEYRVEYVADRTMTMGKAFLGLTVECARCHDHRYDPISQKEYYQLFAFFNNINEVGNIPYAGEASPTLMLLDEETERQWETLRAQITDLEAQTAISNTNFDGGYTTWKAGLKAGREDTALQPEGRIGYYPLDELTGEKNTFENQGSTPKAGYYWGDQDKLPLVVPGKFGTALKLQGDGWLDAGDELYDFERNEPFSISLWVNAPPDSVDQPLFARSGSLFNGNRGYICVLQPGGTLNMSLNHVLPDNSIEVQTQEMFPYNQWNHLVMTYDGSSRADGLTLYLNGAALPTQTLVDNLKQSIRHTITPEGEETNWGGMGNLRLGSIGPNLPTVDSVAVDEWMVFNRRLTTLEVQHLFGEEDPLQGALDEGAEDLLRDYYVTTQAPGYAALFRTLTDVRGKENSLLTQVRQVMVMRERKIPRETFLLDRGAYDAPTTPVHADVPRVLPAFPEDQPRNRLGLARWLTNANHPLTARVTVNRYWQMLFGRGLVATSEDFGNQGALPSHPLLLDWLATRFVASGWDVKALLKEIMRSATYQQVSVADSTQLEQDPHNVLLARGPSYRLPAEMVRDHMLTTSGLLVDSLGGPPVKPYQPPGLWKELATRNLTEYVQDTGSKLYRRSLYTIWKRTTPPPSMISFDAPGRNYCEVRRQRTNTPLQALVLMNDPQYLEAARLLAERMVREAGTSLAARITLGFRLLTSRYPTAEELKVLATLYETEFTHFSQAPAKARTFLTVGEYPRDRSLDVPTVAALAVVANTIMNYDEAVMKR